MFSLKQHVADLKHSMPQPCHGTVEMFTMQNLLLIGLAASQTLQNISIKGTNVPYYSHGSQPYSKLIIGIPGKEGTAKEFLGTLVSATRNCSLDVMLITPELGTTSYNLLEKKLVGPLRLNEILDGISNQFGTESVTVVGFSKGSQAVQRYSLVNRISKPSRFVLGCASSFTFINDTVDYRYGLGNFPAGFNTSTIIETVRKSPFHFACGSLDTSDLDDSPEAVAQGNGRLERAKNYQCQLKSLGVETSFQTVKKVGHKADAVIGATGAFLCAAKAEKSAVVKCNK
jgi:hypothetical protein